MTGSFKSVTEMIFLAANQYLLYSDKKNYENIYLVFFYLFFSLKGLIFPVVHVTFKPKEKFLKSISILTLGGNISKYCWVVWFPSHKISVIPTFSIIPFLIMSFRLEIFPFFVKISPYFQEIGCIYLPNG